MRRTGPVRSPAGQNETSWTGPGPGSAGGRLIDGFHRRGRPPAAVAAGTDLRRVAHLLAVSSLVAPTVVLMVAIGARSILEPASIGPNRQVCRAWWSNKEYWPSVGMIWIRMWRATRTGQPTEGATALDAITVDRPAKAVRTPMGRSVGWMGRGGDSVAAPVAAARGWLIGSRRGVTRSIAGRGRGGHPGTPAVALAGGASGAERHHQRAAWRCGWGSDQRPHRTARMAALVRYRRFVSGRSFARSRVRWGRCRPAAGGRSWSPGR